MQMVAALRAVTVLGCALVALWIYIVPMLSAAGPLPEFGVHCAAGFPAFDFERRTGVGALGTKYWRRRIARRSVKPFQVGRRPPRGVFLGGENQMRPRFSPCPSVPHE
jgi:hypothetical protein